MAMSLMSLRSLTASRTAGCRCMSCPIFTRTSLQRSIPSSARVPAGPTLAAASTNPLAVNDTDDQRRFVCRQLDHILPTLAGRLGQSSFGAACHDSRRLDAEIPSPVVFSWGIVEFLFELLNIIINIPSRPKSYINHQPDAKTILVTGSTSAPYRNPSNSAIVRLAFTYKPPPGTRLVTHLTPQGSSPTAVRDVLDRAWAEHRPAFALHVAGGKGRQPVVAVEDVCETQLDLPRMVAALMSATGKEVEVSEDASLSSKHESGNVGHPHQYQGRALFLHVPPVGEPYTQREINAFVVKAVKYLAKEAAVS
ncbi:hypothetical protein BCR44DRAFT_1435070 [Catenaria anguillulae PL171]|uniref:Uncharacterized protein n=1 Tax=Catenaria anguillulae PL171 TaxID=765915 RepID=A0A1Y2HN14_9FUNG|nr:hypothetical protein BCR44DRAFT_1435070 [Catenaria anguillulae PL171]